MDDRFILQEQFLKDSFIDPMTAKVNSLADQVERMATKEELGQLRSEVVTQVQATLSWDKLNMVEWMAARMIECRLDRRGALVFQPYIMALVNHKTVVLDVDDEVHKAFCPFKNKKVVLE